MSQVIHLTSTPCETSSWFTKDQVEIIKNVVSKDLSEDEFKMFLYICKRHNLDPIAKQIYAVKRGGQMTIQTGIDGLRLIAERTGKYAPGKGTEFAHDEKGYLISATAYVKKFTGNEWHQVSATAMLCEYNTNTPIWKKMPHVMLEKCAEARALRRAFPGDLSGLYAEEEMQQANISVVQKKEEELLSQEQVDSIKFLLINIPELEKKMLEFCSVQTIEDIKKSQFEVCIRTINTYIERKNNEDSRVS